MLHIVNVVSKVTKFVLSVVLMSNRGRSPSASPGFFRRLLDSENSSNSNADGGNNTLRVPFVARALSASPKIFRRNRSRSSSAQPQAANAIPNGPVEPTAAESGDNEANKNAGENADAADSGRRQSRFARFISNPPHMVQERLEFLRSYRKSRGRSVRRKITQGSICLTSVLTSRSQYF